MKPLAAGDRVTIDAGALSWYRQLDRLPATVLEMHDDEAATVQLDEPPAPHFTNRLTVPLRIVERRS